MAMGDYARFSPLLIILIEIAVKCSANDILGCGGFVKSHANLDFSKIEIGLYSKEGSLKEKTECAPTNGYYFLPLYEKGEYILKVHPPPGWSFEPSQVDLLVDGVTDQCSTGYDINFTFNGFGITGKVITAGQATGPAGVLVKLINDKGDVRDTTTTIGGDFHFTPVIPGKYTVKASHPRWKLEPSQTVVHVKEGNTALPPGVLTVKGYDVTGTITSYGNPIAGAYILLYSIEENLMFRVEGCNTALLQGVPDALICHSVSDSSGEFKFGLVPAGEYKLMALSKSPGQATVTYNIKPDSVPFSVRHDSLFIRNAFEITGYTVVGSVVSSVGGPGIAGVRVSLDGEPVGVTDKEGKYTLPSLLPGTYSVGFEHEQCELNPVEAVVSATGQVRLGPGVAARWRACGRVLPAGPAPRAVRLTGDHSAFSVTVTADPDNGGKWCTFLPPGVYTAKVEVEEEEQRNGLQFYPLTHKITVGNSVVPDVVFSQLKSEVSGKVVCKVPSLCEGLTVTLRPISPDGTLGAPVTTTVKEGEYRFAGVRPGGAGVWVAEGALCWSAGSVRVQLAAEHVRAPPLLQLGYRVQLQASHAVQVEYKSANDSGVLPIPAGSSSQCLPESDVYTLTPIGCHKYEPASYTVDTRKGKVETVELTAVSHAVVVSITCGSPAPDVFLRVSSDAGPRTVGPLVPQDRHGGGYLYQHTIYLKENEIVVVSGSSASQLFVPSSPTQLVGGADCQPHALTLRAHTGLVLAGRVEPPVEGVTVVLTADDGSQVSQSTGADGVYRFGPLEATRTWSVSCSKEGFVFSSPGAGGVVRAVPLARLLVALRDTHDKPLQGALVSVSGGSYRRNLVSAANGTIVFSDLSPLQYYVKPLMKEYRFQPPHQILDVEQGKTHEITLKAARVAWSCVGAARLLSGRGAGGCQLLAVGEGAAPPEEATTDANGHFRIRGLSPGVQYRLQLKDCATPELVGARLAMQPPLIQITDNKDIEDVRLIVIQPYQVTDVNVLVYAPNVDHYKHLRLTLTLENTPHAHLYSTKLDSAGFSQTLNPGLMYVLPRLPNDNKTYVLQLESTLSKSTHQYEDMVYYFTSDGRFKSFRIDFEPKVKSSEQELRQTSLLVVPLLLALAYVYSARARLLAALTSARGPSARVSHDPRAASPAKRPKKKLAKAD